MKNSNNRSLLEETRHEAAEIEAELARHPELDDLEVTEEMDEALFEKIRAYEESVEHSTEETVPAEAEEAEKTILYRKKKKRIKIYIALVAVLVMMIGLGVSSVGSKSYLKQVWDKNAGDEDVKVTNVEDMDERNTDDGDELSAYQEIYNQLGINVPRIQYKPKGMNLIRYELDEEIQSAILIYDYQGNIIRYYIYLNNQDSSLGVKMEDEKIDSYIVNENNLYIAVDVYEVKNQEECRLVGVFDYKGAHYELKGMMEQKEFDKILKNLNFL